ncbi:MAG: glucosamine-6-phosphate deaminase [Alphaproteobacteria bacterium]|jgi:glucosamine-6-phosphate deaminase|nr:glucosamine-6-phosphate deaminase [Alphaproteobacteria bacterium]
MRLIITKNVGLWTATYVKERLKDFNPKDCFVGGESNFVLGLPTGGTAVDLYKNLVAFYKAKEVSFEHITTFNMDEYISLPRDHKESYWTFMHEHLFNHVDMNKKNINIPDGNAADIKKFCREYEEKIKVAGGVDLFIGGVGENGHIAFNEPFSSFSSRTRDKELNKNTIEANARFFGGDINLVPKKAITVGIQTLLDSKEVLIMMTGVKKALALQHCLEGPITHQWPVSVLQMHQKALIVVDEDAASELKVKTYRFFKDFEDEYSYIEDLCK